VQDHNTPPNGGSPSNEDLWNFLKGLNDRVAVMEHRHGYVSSAFPQNDLGKPDYDGHRRSHLALIEQDKVVEGYKGEITKTILSILAGVVLTLIGSGILQALTK